MRALKVGNVFAINELRQAMPRWPNNKVFGVLGCCANTTARAKDSTQAARRTASCCANCC